MFSILYRQHLYIHFTLQPQVIDNIAVIVKNIDIMNSLMWVDLTRMNLESSGKLYMQLWYLLTETSYSGLLGAKLSIQIVLKLGCRRSHLECTRRIHRLRTVANFLTLYRPQWPYDDLPDGSLAASQRKQHICQWGTHCEINCLFVQSILILWVYCFLHIWVTISFVNRLDIISFA